MIGVYLDEGKSVKEAIAATVERLEGAYSFVIFSTLDPESLYAIKNSGTMVIGICEELSTPAKKDT